MSRLERYACLFVGLALAAGSLEAALPPRAASAADAPAPLSAPQWVGGTESRGKAQLTWIRNPAFTAVRVYRRDEGSPAPFRQLAETSENTWLDHTVQPGRIYRYRLAGIGPDGTEGRPSTELAVRIGASVLLAPAPPAWEGYLVLGDGVGLKWAAQKGEDVIVWNIFRKSPPETEFQLVGSSRGTSYLDVDVEPGRLYVYALTALDSGFRETPFSPELAVRFTPQRQPAEPRPAEAWVVRRTRLVDMVGGGGGLAFVRPADVAVGSVTGDVYVADSGRNLVFVFSSGGVFKQTLGAGPGGGSIFKNVLGLALDRDEKIHIVDAGAGVVQVFSPRGRLERTVALPPPEGLGAVGPIDAAVGPDGRLFIVDNLNSRVAHIGRDGAVGTFGRAGATGGEFSAPTFCAVDATGNFYVSDCLNARVQVLTGSGEFIRAFGRADRRPGGFGRPKGIAIGTAGEIFVADSWLNTIQVFDAEGRFVAILGDENGRPLDLGSPNGVALGPGNRIYVAERLAARLQIREIIDGQ